MTGKAAVKENVLAALDGDCRMLEQAEGLQTSRQFGVPFARRI